MHLADSSFASPPSSWPAPFAAFQDEVIFAPSPLRLAVTDAYRRDERQAVQWLLVQFPVTGPSGNALKEAAQQMARTLVAGVREKRMGASGVDALMHEFSLSSEEGIALMCLAEALLRIPDHQTADRLIADKIGKGDWYSHVGNSTSLFVNAATWGLFITGKLVRSHQEHDWSAVLTKLIAKGGEPLIRKGVDLAMRMLGNQFVTGQTIEEALSHSRLNEAHGYRYSYDMLGEAALTEEDARAYFSAYESAIHAIGTASQGRGIKDGPGISIKLSALHPRYSRMQRARVLNELLPRIKHLVRLAKHYDIGLNIDAEETDRLELSLDLMEALAFDPELAGFSGIGFVVQAYQKRCPYVIDYLIDLAHRSQRSFMIRLVKGAYWDSEIKRAQVDGQSGYPVYTRKVYTDVSYLVCAQKLLAATDVIYPQFATHNAHTLSTIYTWAQERGITDYEFQCLHGMGETLYDQIVGPDNLNKACRIYAPVGSHQTLLAYLVRRLLENGANSSFVNQIVDEQISIESLIADPFEAAQQQDCQPHPHIPLPHELYGAQHRNAKGIDLSNEDVLRELGAAFEHFGQMQWQASPLLAVDSSTPRPPLIVCNPADRRDIVGYAIEADDKEVERALQSAHQYAAQWQAVPAGQRADTLLRSADLFEEHAYELMALAIREAGKSLPNAIAEVREAIDFLRYYAVQICKDSDTAALGPITCISPWNFPLAIFTGQISAALAAGNPVLAKPAEQTPLIAFRAVQLLHEAGIPRTALQFLPGSGDIVGATLTADTRVCGVIFTGSTEVAQLINRTLAKRIVKEGRDIPLIAETGGQNAMIVDSSALPEQVVQDVLNSAFDSAGQRCSALRILCLQEDIADKTIAMLKGAMQELCVGNPDRLATDIGPVIDEEAQHGLRRHIDRMKTAGNTLYQLPVPDACMHGTFVMPTLIDIASLSELQREVFGPVLHIVRYRRDALPALINAINATGYGLTLGIHSRIDATIDFIIARAHVGNIYVNRNIVGAVVGVQPFGGEGKSGTGPKAGGPLYLKRLSRNPSIAPCPQIMAVPFLATRSLRAFDHLLGWAKAHAPGKIGELAEHYAQSSLLNKTVPMPGPTGERNTLSFAPRGAVLCMASSTDGLLNQLAAAWCTGNHAIVPRDMKPLIPADLLHRVEDAIEYMDIANDALKDKSINIALVDASQANAMLPILAAREGALIPVIQTSDHAPLPLWRLLTERAVCINLTAAGGNTSLMMSGK